MVYADNGIEILTNEFQRLRRKLGKEKWGSHLILCSSGSIGEDRDCFLRKEERDEAYGNFGDAGLGQIEIFVLYPECLR